MLERDGRQWRLGTEVDVAWLQSRPSGHTVETAMPLTFEAYATLHPLDGAEVEYVRYLELLPAHERAVVDILRRHTTAQPWLLGYLDTGAHDVVFPAAPRVRAYWDWPYVLVEAGPDQALTWRTEPGFHGCLPDLYFPADRSWVVTGLWDDTWSCVGGPAELVSALVAERLTNARRVLPHDDACPPDRIRD